jgi:hypothetical protein
MTTRTQSWLGIALATLLLAALAWSTSSSGTQTCMRCGTVDEQEWIGPVVWHSSEHPSGGTAWFESVSGKCGSHEWRRTGCWFSRGILSGRVSCTKLQDRHELLRVCSELADQELARAVAQHFAALTPEQRLAMFRTVDETVGVAAERDVERLAADLRVWSTGPVYTPLVFTR